MADTVVLDPNLTVIDVQRKETEERRLNKELLRKYRDEYFDLGVLYTNSWHAMNEAERALLDKRLTEVANIINKVKKGMM